MDLNSDWSGHQLLAMINDDMLALAEHVLKVRLKFDDEPTRLVFDNLIMMKVRDLTQDWEAHKDLFLNHTDNS